MFKYSEILNVLQNKNVEIRHDVDVSLLSAFRMAKYESELGFKSIYYIRFDSDYYNVLSDENQKIINFLIQNHEVGCHVDVTNIKNENDLLDYLNNFKKIIEFDKFTFHINTEKTMSFKEIEGYINKSILYGEYISDSKNIFTKQTLNKINKLNEYTLLIHPEWWDTEGFYFSKNGKEKLIESLRIDQLKKRVIKEILNIK